MSFMWDIPSFFQDMIIVQFLNPSIPTVHNLLHQVHYKCTFPLHKKGGHIMNEWLAYLCNPQLKSQQLQDLKGAMLPSIKRL